MILIGLGNKGKEYINTRHNVGYEFIDYARSALNKYGYVSKDFTYNKYTQSFELKLPVDHKQVFLIKPDCYMNESGDIVSLIRKFHKVDPSDIIIVHDDLDLTLGRYLIQIGKGPHIHNGVLSIEENIGRDFWRIRIGVDNREGKSVKGVDYVLGKFYEDEKNVISEVFPKILVDFKNKFIN